MPVSSSIVQKVMPLAADGRAASAGQNHPGTGPALPPGRQRWYRRMFGADRRRVGSQAEDMDLASRERPEAALSPTTSRRQMAGDFSGRSRSRLAQTPF